MTIWIDPPIWPAHGTLWSHIISDESVTELHRFAEDNDVPRRSFDADHYDVPEHRYANLVEAGATPTSGSDLARRLLASGLRFRKRKGERWLARAVNGLPGLDLPHTLDVVVSRHEPPSSSGAAVVLIAAPGGGGPDPENATQLVLVRSVSRPGWAPPGGKRETEEDVRTAAVREVGEETGLRLNPADLEPVGFERIGIEPGDELAPWDAGDNHIAVFGIRLADAVPVRPGAPDVDAALWVSVAEAEQRCAGQHWWPLVDRWLRRE